MTLKVRVAHYFSDTNQLARIVLLTGVLLVLVVASFGGYYYYDRYLNVIPTSQKSFIIEAEQMVRDDPQNIEKRLALAETYMFNQYFMEAITQANQILAAEPDLERAWLVLGVSSAQVGRPADAIQPLGRFIEARKESEMPGLDKSLQAAAYYLGDSYLQLGQPEEALAPLKLAVEWSQMDADSMYKLGVAFYGVQDYPNAAMMLHAATTFVPNFAEAYDVLAAVYTAMGEPGLVEYAQGMAAFSRKEYPGAVSLLLQSAQIRPDFAPTFTGLGLTYEAAGDYPLALSAYQSAVSLAPNSFTALRGVERAEILIKNGPKK
jgi:tetratricopeptide (TPR) repeat protein